MVRILTKACQGWGLLTSGQEPLIASDAQLPKKGLAAQLAKATLPLFPYGQMVWAQFAALFTQFKLCSEWNAEDVIKKEARLQCTGRNHSDCDCFSVVRENLDFLFHGAPFRGAPLDQVIGRMLNTFGQWWMAPLEMSQQEDLGIAGRRELWGRFLFRQNLSGIQDKLIEDQMQWAKSMAQQATRVSAFAAQRHPARALLTFVGQARAEVKDPSGKKLPFGTSRTGQFVRSIITPFVGGSIYPGLWRKVLLERLALGRTPFFEPTPADNNKDRASACATTVTSVDLPWRECEAAMPPGADINNQGDDRIAGVSRSGDVCRIVLNRAVGQSVLDSVLLGEDCSEWYGSSHLSLDLPINFRLWAVMLHASPLAIDLVQGTLLHQELRAYFDTVDELWSQLACRAPDQPVLGFIVPHPAWARLLQHLATIYWYFLNMMPYERGSSTAGLLLHHGLLMAAFPPAQQNGALLRCVPLFKAQVLPDWTALASTLQEFLDGAYEGLFEKRLQPACLHDVLFGKSNALP